MKKLNYQKFTTLFAFFACDRVTKSKSKNGIAFWRYVLCKKIDKQTKKDLLKQYNNIAFGCCYNKYAKEVEYNTILIFDKVLK